jgi:hypothetical protein
MNTDRRQFLAAAAGSLASIAICSRASYAAPESSKPGAPDLARQVGINTSSVSNHFSFAGRTTYRLEDLPKWLRDEVDLRVIDIGAKLLSSLQPRDLERFRAAVDKAGCTVTNVKLNQREPDLAETDPQARARMLETARTCIDAAAILGARWVRPFPNNMRPATLQPMIDGFREMIAYGAPEKVSLLVENIRWLDHTPEIAAQVVQEVGPGVAAQPDTGNWPNDQIRYAGLARMFPLAASCDFKFLELGPDGEHPHYDLKKCFQTGWDAGFRGPWIMEHRHADLKREIKELSLVRDLLKKWMAEQSNA